MRFVSAASPRSCAIAFACRRAGAKRRGILQGPPAPAGRRLRGRQRLRHRRAAAGASICPRNCPASRPSWCRTCRRRPAWSPANHMYLQAARDGSVIGGISRNLPSQAMMGLPNIEADPRRFNWLGATSFPGRVCVAPAACAGEDRGRHVQDRSADRRRRRRLLDQHRADRAQPRARHQVQDDRGLSRRGRHPARDRARRGAGRVHVARPVPHLEQKFKDGKLRYLLRAEESPLPGVPDVPSIYDFAKTDEQRQLMRFIFSSTEFGRPYLFPPDVPKDRVQFMRKAIDAAVKDPELIAEAAKMKLDMVYRPPEHLEQAGGASLRDAAGRRSKRPSRSARICVRTSKIRRATRIVVLRRCFVATGQALRKRKPLRGRPRTDRGVPTGARSHSGQVIAHHPQTGRRRDDILKNARAGGSDDRGQGAAICASRCLHALLIGRNLATTRCMFSKIDCDPMTSSCSSPTPSPARHEIPGAPVSLQHRGARALQANRQLSVRLRACRPMHGTSIGDVSG